MIIVLTFEKLDLKYNLTLKLQIGSDVNAKPLHGRRVQPCKTRFADDGRAAPFREPGQAHETSFRVTRGAQQILVTNIGAKELRRRVLGHSHE